MEPLIIEREFKTPEVDFNHQTGMLTLKGRSIHENSPKFFQPLLDWIDNYCLNPHETTNVHIELEYYNSSSHRALSKILDRFQELHKGGHNVKVKWHYESGDLGVKEDGEQLKVDFDYPFDILEL